MGLSIAAVGVLLSANRFVRLPSNPAADAHDRHPHHLDAPVGARDTAERPPVGAAQGQPQRDAIALRHEIVDGLLEVGGRRGGRSSRASARPRARASAQGGRAG